MTVPGFPRRILRPRLEPLHAHLHHAIVTRPTPDGFVEIPPEVVDRGEDEACKVTITPEEERPGEPEAEALLPVPAEERDRPNPPALVRKVLLRNGLTCANPRCGRKVGLQAHHIRFRANGGKTALENECALCPPVTRASTLAYCVSKAIP